MTNFARYDIPGGAFWCRLELVDATPVDIQLNDAGLIPYERKLAIKFAMELQLQSLAQRWPQGTC